MAINEKISLLIDEQVPSFIHEDGPNFIAFVEAYYEWLEQSNNVIEVSKNLLNYQDIDLTYDKYFEYFKREIIPALPEEILADKVLMAKHVKDLYRSKGSELSFRLLFRLLYNEDISLFYPGDYILRASDGRWVKETVVRVGAPFIGDTTQLKDSSIIGINSGATARVESLIKTQSVGRPVYQLYLSSVVGVFEDNETIRNTANTILANISGQVGPLQGVSVATGLGGAFHRVGDEVIFTSTSGSGARGTVLSTASDSSVIFSIVNGGNGYTTNSVCTVTGGSGTGASFVVTGINNLQEITYKIDIIEPVAACVLNESPYFISAGANTSAVLPAFSTATYTTTLDAALTDKSILVGSIASIETTNYGFGYGAGFPTTSVYEANTAPLLIPDGFGSFYGVNAEIGVEYAPGALDTVSLSLFGAGYSKYENVTISNVTRTGTIGAIGVPIVSGIIEYEGKYIDTKGFLSWLKLECCSTRQLLLSRILIRY
jgi:hypothetical protein